MAWKAVVAGVDHTRDIQTAQPCQITLKLNERATAQFRCKPGFVPNRFDPVVLYAHDGVTPLFGGVITNRTIAGFKARGGGEPFSTDVQCGDYFTYLDWAYLSLTYTAPVTLAHVLADIVAALPASSGITLDPAQVAGPPLDPFTWAQMRASDAVRDLSTRTGFVAVISPTKALRMFAPGAVPAPFTITDGAPHCQTFNWTDNPYVPANDVGAVCGPSSQAVATQYWTVGAPSTWPVDIQAVIGGWNAGVVTENPGPSQVNRTLSGPGGGGYYEFDPTAGLGTITVGAGVKPPAGTILQFVYTAQYPFTVYASSGATPVIQFQQQYPNVTDYSQGQELAVGLLAQLNQQPRDCTVTSLDTGWAPGQALAVALTARLTSNFVLTAVTLTLSARQIDAVWVTAFQGTESQTYQGSYLDQWRALTGTAGGGSSGGGVASVPPITTGGGSGGGVAGTGTAGRLAEWTAATTLGDGPIAADVILASGSYPNPPWLTAIGLDKLAPIPALTLLGNAGAVAAPPAALAAAAARAVLGLATTDTPTFAGLVLTGSAAIGGSVAIAGAVGTPGYVAQTTGWRITPGGAADVRSLYADTATIAGTLTLGGNLTVAGFVGSPSYTSQLTGWRITAAGAADVRYLYADELHTKAFIADLEQALAGGQIISKSVAKVATTANGGFRVGTDTQLIVESFAGFATAAVFQNGDTVRLRSFARTAGALTVTDAFGTVTLDTTYGAGGFDAPTMTQAYTFTKTSGTNILANTGTLALDYGVSGNGYYEVTAVDGTWGAAAPYAQVVTWSGSPSTLTCRTRLGNVSGVFGTAGEYGLFAGDYAGKRYLRASSAGVELHGLDFLLWDGTITTFKLDHTVPSFAMGNPIPTGYGTGKGTGMWMGKDTDGVYKFRVGTPGSAGMFWDGTSLTITGVSGGALTGIPAGGAASDVNTYSTTISGGKITTGSITGNKLLITAAGACLNADPTFEDLSLWGLYQGVRAAGAGGHGNYAVLSTSSGGSYCLLNSEYIPIDKLKVYRLSAWVWQSGTATGVFQMGIGEFDGNKTSLGNTYAISNLVPTTALQFYSFQIQPTFAATAYVYLFAVLNNGGTAGQHAIANFRLEEMAPSTLIQDGAITTSKIFANAVTAGQIAAGTITTTQIAANTITGGNIAAGTITAGNIAAGTITAAQIAAGSITGTQIAASTITGGNIAAGTITAGNLAAGTITAGQIAAGTITSTQIAARSITADRIVAHALTATEIQAGTITANEIAANSITADRLSVGSLSAISANLGTVTAGSITGGTINGATVYGGNGSIRLDSSGLNFLGSGGAAQINMNGALIQHFNGGVNGLSESNWVSVQGGFFNNSDMSAGGQLFCVGRLTAQSDFYLSGNIFAASMTAFVGGTSTPVYWNPSPNNGLLSRGSSSRRYKENILAWAPAPTASILTAQPAVFNFKGGTTILGFIAEDFELIDPLLVIHDLEGRPDGIHHEALFAHLVVAMQDVARRLTALEGHA